ncbi:GIY-YIG nuclease family protein [Nostoc sp. FACHB-190]|uniref:GIY-YIG nuclease family protein n=1 Tax=Nostoc sp. FACHB-190 TaxID=2692838 RepID=UPI0028C41650|nr:GIY-YIG nuclease family protein [Nostoc sp. FACHB-190]
MVADARDRVWYVGQAANLKSRWSGKTHHRYAQLIRSNKKRGYGIYWKEIAVESLNEQEKYYIALFRPELNGSKVKSSLPKTPQAESEIKRLLKVLNKPTLLFPIIRSLVIGEYRSEDRIRCIIVAIDFTDYPIVSNSIHTKRSSRIKKAWNQQQFYCEKSKQEYFPIYVYTYSLYNYRFEFISMSNLLIYLEKNVDEYNSYVRTAELFGIPVKALKHLDILREISAKAEYFYVESNGKKYLRDLDYINYRFHTIECLKQDINQVGSSFISSS